MWELRTADGPRELCYPKSALEPRRCPICGQYFKADEKYYIIVCNSIPEARDRQLGNAMVHTECWQKFCVGIESNDSLAQKLKKHRTPKSDPFTDEQMKSIEAFKTAAKSYGFIVMNWTREHCLKATRRGTTSSVVYNPYSGNIYYKDRCKDTLFKDMFDRQVAVNVYNKMHELLRDGKRDDYSALKIVSDAVKAANEVFNA